ncbi:uncharacterized protein LOC121257111 isoform X1 [Juglans microcarpa x Juglans regia]|uniref:uncharacterized protein LOC121257111 isoform X1 n=1 Tax=Juglans microcarpa x Juglans regia TaxID=2249226 RepID=UPI001B7E8D4C|nr:uncharacterized protein LOC121257111 isoform X1 [Juglans microcarpa x Juglans regia]
MGETDSEVIEISPPSSEKKLRRKISQESQDFYFLVSSYCSAEEDETSMRPMLCLNSKSSVDIKSIEEVEDCFILDYDPFESIDFTKLSVNINPSDAFAASDGTSDLCVIAEKGQVACRDYPHSRHLCVDFPFETTPHENYCKLCFCYVCDSAAPCKYWTDLKLAHCNASEHVGDWTYQRKLRKQASAEFK